jgi:hypothetical protein
MTDRTSPIEYGYMRIIDVFDKNETAGAFLSDDGEGGFAAGVARMADEIDRLRSCLLDKPEAGEAVIEKLQNLHDEQHSILGQMLLDKSEEGQRASNWQGGKVNGIATAISALSVSPLSAGDAGEIERLRTALEFYADESRWEHFSEDEQAKYYCRNSGSVFGHDMGFTARAALEAVKGDRNA